MKIQSVTTHFESLKQNKKFDKLIGNFLIPFNFSVEPIVIGGSKKE